MASKQSNKFIATATQRSNTVSSILIQHKSEADLDKSEIGKQLESGLVNCMQEVMTVKNNTGQRLASLLGVSSLPNLIIFLLVRPWQRANMLATWCEGKQLSAAKEPVKTLIRSLKKAKRDFMNIPKAVDMLMLFETSTELKVDGFLNDFDVAIRFFEGFSQLELANGKNYSASYFRRYALNSLFYMGKKMGLLESGAPTQLNEYIHIVTDRLYQDIDKDHYRFNNTNFMDEFARNKNTPLMLIFNPYCNITDAMLQDINMRFLIS